MTRPPLLLDVGAVSCGCVDHALETFAKAINGEDGESPDIWAKHESPFIQSLIEQFTARGLLRLAKVREELEAWIDGKHHKPTGKQVSLNPAALTWTDDEIALVRIYLENLPPADFKASDWSLVVEYLAHRYLPAGSMRSEAEWLAARSSMMGKVAAHYAAVEDFTVHEADAIVAALPLTVAGTVEAFGYTGAAAQILSYASERCCELVVQLTDETRHRMKTVILDYEQQKIEGSRPPRQALTQRLFDEFSTLNRDWRRIAVTEAGTNANNGLIASLAVGSRVKRIEQYRGACSYCRKIHGRVMEVVDPSARDKDGELQVWVNKNNVGRSASPRKRVGDRLVDRLPHELYWPPAGTVHPHCRGFWLVLQSPKPADDPGFQKWLDKHVHKHKIGDTSV